MKTRYEQFHIQSNHQNKVPGTKAALLVRDSLFHQVSNHLPKPDQCEIHQNQRIKKRGLKLKALCRQLNDNILKEKLIFVERKVNKNK